MEYNRYNRNNQFRRNHQQMSYSRGSNQGRFQDRRGSRRPYQGNFYNPRPPVERTFDHSGKEVYECQRHRSPIRRSERSDYSRETEEVPVVAQLTPFEQKAKDFLHMVLNQEGFKSKLIFLQTVDNPIQTLQGTTDYHQMQFTVDPNATGEYVLKINGQEVVKGTFPSKQSAKAELAEQALNLLKKESFYIIKKKVYEEISTAKASAVKEDAKPQASFEGSKAHQMMLKMGWGGKGLGVNEQGVEKTVAETIDQNISRQGLGTDDVFRKIHIMLEEYSKSDKMSLLRFDPDFTSEERAHIHKIATRFGLKSKSEGKGDKRRITVTKKLNRGDLVYNLLTNGLENDLYKLIVPAKYEHLWFEEEEEEDDVGNYHPHFSN